MYPFIEKYDETKDKELIEAACNGSIEAMDKLVKLHQRFIYNVALKFSKDTNDAADLTQEVLIKMITKLGLFQNKSSFRTWLYRIVMNHFISSKRKTNKEFSSFEDMGIFADYTHNDEEMTLEEQVKYSDNITQIRNSCMSSMLLCLDNQQRVVFILGGVFNLKSTIASPLLGISAENFRKQLSRAKADLFQFMDNKCGLMNAANPCRCHKKTMGFIKEGKVDIGTMTFNNSFSQTIEQVSDSKNDELDLLIEGKYMHFFRSRVYEDTQVCDSLIESLLFDPEIKQLFHLN